MTNSISRRRFGAAAAGVAATTMLADAARADGKSDALESVNLSKVTLDRVLADAAMSGFANALGGARGIVIMPKLLTVGFIVGYTSGTGILLARDINDQVVLLFSSTWSMQRLIDENAGVRFRETG